MPVLLKAVSEQLLTRLNSLLHFLLGPLVPVLSFFHQFLNLCP